MRRSVCLEKLLSILLQHNYYTPQISPSQKISWKVLAGSKSIDLQISCALNHVSQKWQSRQNSSCGSSSDILEESLLGGLGGCHPHELQDHWEQDV